MCNSSKIKEIFFPAEKYIRLLSEAGGRENCFVFTVYDMCRENKASLQLKLEKKLVEPSEESKDGEEQ